MSGGMLSIGITGIRAAQLGLEATQHNVANANTPGYSRQYIQQSAGIPRLTGSGYFGSGTTVDTVRRAYDKYLTVQTFSAQTQASESAAYLAKVSQVDNMLGDANSGLAPALQSFFTGVQQVAANPSLVSARQSMLSASEALAARFNSMSQRLNELYDGVNGEVISEVELVNLYAVQIGEVNGQITRAEAATDQPPNDLLDMRDQLVADLNKHIRVSTVEDSIGNFNVFIGNGQQLVVGSVVNSLVATTSSYDPERIVVGLKGQSGTVQELTESYIEGGALGGLMKFRANSLDDATNTLGQIAASLALTFNAQHALGQDLEGLNQESSGIGFQADYFKISQPKVIAGSVSAAVVSASFLPPTGDPATGNFKTSLTGSDYVLRDNGTNLTLTRKSDSKVWTTPTGAGAVATLNGLISSEGISINGTPSANVDYLVEPTRNTASNFQLNSTIAADTRKIAAAAPIATSLGSANSGSLKVSQGVVSQGYSLTSLPAFTYGAAADQFTVSPASAGTATYANGNVVSIASGGAVPRLNGGSELSRVSYNGISVDISGVPSQGDSFSIVANTNGVSDSRNALKLGALQIQSTMENGKATFQGSYASLVSGVGSVTRQVKVIGESQQTLLKQNELARSAVSGVNLDEEAANLIRYQQAYQASAKALDISARLFDTLLAISN